MTVHDVIDPATPAAAQSLELVGYPAVGNLIEERADVDHDVLIVGAGQTGIGVAFALRKSGVERVDVIDAAADEADSAWRTAARMRTLRTPKTLAGPELGIPALSFRAWYEAAHGARAYAEIARIATADWADYLDWFRQQVGIEVRRGTRLIGIEATDDGVLRVTLRSVGPDGAEREWSETTRKILLATGVSGTGGPRIPDVVAGLSPEVFAHSADDIDFAALAGKNVAVLGAAASAFDAAATALEAGAATVAVYSRRPELVIAPQVGPRPNPLVQDIFHLLSDDERWRRRQETVTKGASVPVDSVERVAVFDGYKLHLGAAWRRATERNGQVEVEADDGSAVYDFVIAGTGYQQDPATRPELAALAPHIALWRDLYEPPAGRESDILAATPYLGSGYELVEVRPGEAPWLSDIHVFSIGANVSFGLPVGDVPSLRTGIPRVAEAIIRDLVLADVAAARAAPAGNS